jgi:hypothetical protein
MARKGYDWPACVIAVVAGMGVAITAGLAVTRIVDSTLLLTTVVTLVGVSVSQWTYSRVARRGSRPIDDENC